LVSCRPTVILLYPLYASVQAMESPSKLDDEQWLAYWILYSFITLMEMVLESLIYWYVLIDDFIHDFCLISSLFYFFSLLPVLVNS
jgi:hypothetical protein